MIPIQNIYYMLAYAFSVLNEQGFKNVGTEKFENTLELFSAILIKGVNKQLKQGLGKEYTLKNEPVSVLRGKIDITESIKTRSIYKKQLVCSYDELSVNNYKNQIIKATMLMLLKSNLTKSRKKEVKQLLVFFSEVDLIDVHNINWQFQYDKNNQTYRMLISICNLILKGLLQTETNGTTKLMNFLDEQRMCRLFEKFILEYYKKEFPEIKVSSPYIKWQVDNDLSNMLPTMKTDVMLCFEDKVLIIDAKYYTKTVQTNFNKQTLHSGNLYQIFTYVKNKEVELANQNYSVSGMLLYAKTDEVIQPDNEYIMSGNKVSVKTLDLNCDFDVIKKQLNEIAYSEFKLEK